MGKGFSVVKSEELYERAKNLIPWGTQTNAKRPNESLKGFMPLYIERAKGCRLFDLDGNEYIDYRASLGPIILGYCYPAVNRAVVEQLRKGSIFSMASPIEMDLAEELTHTIPCAETVRFLKTGGDATSATIRIARAYTGREKVISCGYQGWHDWWAAKNVGIEKGVPNVLRNYCLDLQYNNLEQAERLVKDHHNEIACIITVPYNLTDLPRDNFLKGLRELTEENDILLVFDEIITGFRLAMGGAQEYFGVTPDLAVFAKAMSNGFPLSAFVGRREYMKKAEELMISTTYGGETLSIAAAIATIRELRGKRVHAHIWAMGKKLTQGFDKLAEDHGIKAKTVGLPPVPVLQFRDENENKNKALEIAFMREMMKNGVFANQNWFITYSHKEEDIEETLEAADRAMGIAAQEVAKIA